jgi:hypothetical protein
MSESREGRELVCHPPPRQWPRVLASAARKVGDGALRGIGYATGTTAFGLVVVWWQSRH